MLLEGASSHALRGEGGLGRAAGHQPQNECIDSTVMAPRQVLGHSLPVSARVSNASWQLSDQAPPLAAQPLQQTVCCNQVGKDGPLVYRTRVAAQLFAALVF